MDRVERRCENGQRRADARGQRRDPAARHTEDRSDVLPQPVESSSQRRYHARAPRLSHSAKNPPASAREARLDQALSEQVFR